MKLTMEGYRAIRQCLDDAERLYANRLSHPKEWENLELARKETYKYLALMRTLHIVEE